MPPKLVELVFEADRVLTYKAGLRGRDLARFA